MGFLRETFWSFTVDASLVFHGPLFLHEHFLLVWKLLNFENKVSGTFDNSMPLAVVYFEQVAWRHVNGKLVLELNLPVARLSDKPGLQGLCSL